MASRQDATSASSNSELRVYNTLTRQKEAFQPLHPPRVGIYLCGPTVYKPSHIGHMVGPVIFDAIKRYLSYTGYEVTFVINITDVDDKLIQESVARNMSMDALAEEMIQDYHHNLAAMGIDTIDHFPRATTHIDEILQFIQTLIEKGFAYAADGDVYFDVSQDADYGKLSRRSLDAMKGEGGEMGAQKRSPADFALWKAAKSGEPSWDSPWGPGRPGWHIECSAMSRRYLGESFDIHGGGLDLVFPHHENEIAQSECCHGAPQAKYWMHNGLVQASHEVGKVGGRHTREIAAGDQEAQEAGKMGKSKGASAFRDLLQRHTPESIRFFILSTHYRSPIDFSEERIRQVATGLDAFHQFIKRYRRVTGTAFYEVSFAARRAESTSLPEDDAIFEQVQTHRMRFLTAMDDDFNTGGAVGELFDLLRTLNRFIDEHKLDGNAKGDEEKLSQLRLATGVFRELTAVLGLFREEASAAEQPEEGLVEGLMQLIISMRADARQRKDFSTADKIRDGLKNLGVELQDHAQGTDWSRG